MKHQHSHIVLFIIATSILVFVGVLYGYMRYRITTTLERVIAGRTVVVERDQNLSQENNLTLVYKATEKDRLKAISVLVPGDSTISFIETIESLGAAVGSVVTLSSITADDIDSIEPGAVAHIQARVDIQGSWSAVMKTLKLAETLPYAVTVSNVRFDVSGLGANGSNSSRDWKASFLIDGLLVKNKK